ncbi:hypothetical protein T261_5777 [Streptomyces lydicus]|nr:hypothetical protein T261_5777 [Streptomyces lydicus]
MEGQEGQGDREGPEGQGGQEGREDPGRTGKSRGAQRERDGSGAGRSGKGGTKRPPRIRRGRFHSTGNSPDPKRKRFGEFPSQAANICPGSLTSPGRSRSRPPRIPRTPAFGHRVIGRRKR